MLGKFLAIIVKYFLRSSLSSPSGTLIMQMLVHLILSYKSLRLSSFLFIPSSLLCLQWFPPLYLPAYLFILLPHLFCYWVPLNFSFQLLFISKSSSSSLNLSCIFLVCASILFPNLTSCLLSLLSSFSGRLPISCSSRFLSCPLLAIHLYHLILSDFLCLWFPFHRVIIPVASDICCLVVEVGPGACAGFLLGRTSACPLVGGAGSSPSDGHVKWCVYRWLWAQYNFRQPIYWWVGLCATLLVGWPEASQHWSLHTVGHSQVLLPKWRPYDNHYSLRPLPPVFLPPQWATADPHFPRILKPAGRFNLGSYGVTGLCWFPVHMKPWVHLSRVNSVSSSPALTHRSSRPHALGDPPHNARSSGWGA